MLNKTEHQSNTTAVRNLILKIVGQDAPVRKYLFNAVVNVQALKRIHYNIR